jgi:hypothetical protein
MNVCAKEVKKKATDVVNAYTSGVRLGLSRPCGELCRSRHDDIAEASGCRLGHTRQRVRRKLHTDDRPIKVNIRDACP